MTCVCVCACVMCVVCLLLLQGPREAGRARSSNDCYRQVTICIEDRTRQQHS